DLKGTSDSPFLVSMLITKTEKPVTGEVTAFVLITCVVAAIGGLLFGYDLGITGEVMSMEPFLVQFFPDVYKQMMDDSTTNQYCKFDNQLLTLFTSSLYLTALMASFFAATTSRWF
ncbi:hypothetical protein HN51_019736, partial [Arachis hypogaea]